MHYMRAFMLCRGVMALLPTTTLAIEIVEGQWVQAGMVIGKTQPGHRLHFLKRDVQVAHDGTFVVGLGRDAASTVQLTEMDTQGRKTTYTFDVKQREYREQRIEGVPQHTVQVPEDQLPRIRKEVALTRQARAVTTDHTHFTQTFQWSAKGIISGVYGSRRVYNGEPRRPHYGVDIAAPRGTPVYTPVSGQMTLVHNDMYFSGGTLILDHGHGVSSTFIHLSKILVTVGDEVKQGDPIAEIGSSERATGPHLDWRMNWLHQRIDPQLLMNTLPERL